VAAAVEFQTPVVAVIFPPCVLAFRFPLPAFVLSACRVSAAAQAINEICESPGLLTRVDTSVPATETTDAVDAKAGTDAAGTGC